MRVSRLIKSAISLIVVLLCLLSPNKAAASTATFLAVADATLKSNSPDSNFGGDSTLIMTYDPIESIKDVTLVRFDLSSLPADAIIDSNSLELYLESSGGLDPVGLAVYLVTTPWAESTVTWNTNPTTFPYGLLWQVDGASGWKSIGISTSWITSWRTGSNNGLLIYGPVSGAQGYHRNFISRERGWDPPRLTVTYHRHTAFAGHVYSGNAIGDTSHPLGDVDVALYCSSDPNVQGALADRTSTDELGAFSLATDETCEIYNIMAFAPSGYYSLGATSSNGIIKAAHWIQYVSNQTGQAFTGDAFFVHVQTPSDTTPPDNWTNFAPTQWVTSQTVHVQEQVEDTLSGLDVSTAKCSYSIDGGSSWSPWRSASISGTGGTTTPQIISADIPFGQDSGPASLNLVRFQVADMAGNPGTGPSHAVKVDSVPPQNPTSLISTSHSPGVWSNNPHVAFQWTGAVDDRSGLKGYSYAWDNYSGTVPGVFVDTAAASLTLTAAADSSGWWLHVRAIDQAGNAASGAQHLGPFPIDITPPTVFLTEPATGSVKTATFNVAWSGSDGLSGISGYDVQVSTDGGAWNNWHPGVTYQSAFFTGERARTYSFRVRAWDQAGNVSGWSTSGVVRVGGDVTVRVENENGLPVSGADIYLNGKLQSTYGAAVATLHDVLAGDQLVARYLVEQRPSPKGYHNWVYGDWSYRIYITSLGFDNNGIPQFFTISDPTATQVLVVRRTQPLIGFYVLASVEWEATTAFLDQLMDGFREASAYLFDLTDGQMLFEVIEMDDNKARWAQADYYIQAANGYRANATVGGVWQGTNAHAYMGRGFDWTDLSHFRALVHEFGHYGLDLGDEYFDADGREDTGAKCTTDRSNADGVDQACLMANEKVATEMCSLLTVHPHSTNTMQEATRHEPCWETVYKRYQDTQNPPRWIIQRPQDRGSIMPGPTSIPVTDWVWGGTRIKSNTGACGSFDLRWVFVADGSPAADFDVWVEGNSPLYQGKTDKNGLISIVGAHSGDTIRVQKSCGSDCSNSGSVTANCATGQLAGEPVPLKLKQDPFALAVKVTPSAEGTTVDISAQASTTLAATPTLQIYQAGSPDPLTVALTFDGAAYTGSVALNPALELLGVVRGEAVDGSGHSVVTLTPFKLNRVDSGQITWLRSEDGKVDIFLKPGSLTGDPVVSVSRASQVNLRQEGLVLVGSPYAVTVSNGQEALQEKAAVNIHYDPDAVPGRDPGALHIYRWDEQSQKWVDDGGAVSRENQAVTTTVGRLGTFVLAWEPKIHLPLIFR